MAIENSNLKWIQNVFDTNGFNEAELNLWLHSALAFFPSLTPPTVLASSRSGFN